MGFRQEAQVKENMAESRIPRRRPWKAEEIWAERDVGRGGHTSSLSPSHPVLPPPKPPARDILLSFYLCLMCLCPHSWFAYCTHPEPQVPRPFPTPIGQEARAPGLQHMPSSRTQDIHLSNVQDTRYMEKDEGILREIWS